MSSTRGIGSLKLMCITRNRPTLGANRGNLMRRLSHVTGAVCGLNLPSHLMLRSKLSLAEPHGRVMFELSLMNKHEANGAYSSYTTLRDHRAINWGSDVHSSALNFPNG